MAKRNGGSTSDSLFLVIYRAYENPGAPHAEEHRLLRLSLKKFSSKSNPRIKALYGLAGRRGSVALYECSAAELHQDLMADPTMRLGDVEILPLVSEADFAKGAELSISMQEGLQTA